MIDSLVEKLEKKVVLADGAMGTYFSQKYMTEMEAEEANIATPERIIAIHKEYIEAGAELIRTNTFAVNHGLFVEAERRKEVIEAAVANARRSGTPEQKRSRGRCVSGTDPSVSRRGRWRNLERIYTDAGCILYSRDSCFFV